MKIKSYFKETSGKLLDKGIEYISIKQQYFSKDNKYFSTTFTNDGNDNETSFYIGLPWIAYVEFSLFWDPTKYKERYPEIVHKEKQWGLTITGEYVSFKWGYVDDYMGNCKGTYVLKNWSDIIRGENTSVTWDEATPVLKTEKTLVVNGENITIPITVYKHTGTWAYKRWFDIKRTIYGIDSDVAITVPGKGENSWDMDDEVIQSKYNPKTKLCDAVYNDKTAEEAASKYINSIKKKLAK